MKNIVVCIGNGLLSEAIIKMLKNKTARKLFKSDDFPGSQGRQV